jgi:hypothetical protein
MLVPDNDFSSFLILSVGNIKTLVLVELTEVFSTVGEELPPF